MTLRRAGYASVSTGPIDAETRRDAPQAHIGRLGGVPVCVGLAAHHFRDENLAFGCRLAEPRRDVHVHTDEVIADAPRVAGVYPGPKRRAKAIRGQVVDPRDGVECRLDGMRAV